MQFSSEPRRVDVEITRIADLTAVAQLDERRASSEDGIALNHAYIDVRGWSIGDAKLVQEEEFAMLQDLAGAGWITDEAEELIEEHLFSDYSELAPFDPGMAAAVYALSAAGAVPISCCNGGTIGQQHHSEDVPSILFAAGDCFDGVAIMKAAEAEDLGLVPNGEFAEIFADQVLKFHRFSKNLLSRLQARD